MRPQILVVGADSDICTIIQRALEWRGLQVVTASTGDQALSIIERNEDIRVLILDRFLGEEDGKDILGIARTIRPQLAAIIIAPTMTRSIVAETLPFENDFLFPKPFDLHDLMDTVKEILQRPKRADAHHGASPSARLKKPMLSIADTGLRIDTPLNVATKLFQRFRGNGIACEIQPREEDVHSQRIVFTFPCPVEKILLTFQEWDDQSALASR